MEGTISHRTPSKLVISEQEWRPPVGAPSTPVPGTPGERLASPTCDLFLFLARTPRGKTRVGRISRRDVQGTATTRRCPSSNSATYSHFVPCRPIRPLDSTPIIQQRSSAVVARAAQAAAAAAAAAFCLQQQGDHLCPATPYINHLLLVPGAPFSRPSSPSSCFFFHPVRP
jgi:hypothetical protein